MLLLKEDAKACEINLSAASFLAKTNLGATKTLGAKIAAATVTQKVIAGVVAGAVVVGAGVGAHSALSNKVTFADDYVSPEVLFIDFYDTEKPVAFSNGVTISKYADDDDYMYYFNILFTSDYESLDTYYPGDGYTFLDITTRSEDYTYQKGKLYAKAYNDTIFLVGENASGTKSPLYMVSDANEISPINYVFDYDPGTEGLVSNLLDETDYDLSSWVELYSAIDGYSNTNPNDAYSAYKTSNDELVALILATNETIAEEDADTDEPVTDLTEDVTDNDTIDTNDANNTNNTNDTIEMVSDTSSYIEIGGVYSSSLTINIYSDYDPDYIGNVYYNDSELGELKDLGSNIYSVENYDTKADTGYRLVVMSDNSINLFKDGEYVGNCTLKQRLYS